MVRKDPRPDDAWWDDEGGEWVHAERDADGRLVGEIRRWDRDGVLISTTEYVGGTLHGVSRRYFRDGAIAEDGTYVDGRLHGVHSFMRGDGDMLRGLREAPPSIVAYEYVYAHGDFAGARWRDDQGRQVDRHGVPIPEPPAGVPSTALFTEDQGWLYWERGGEAGIEPIESRKYDLRGALRRVSNYVDGSERTYHENGQLWRDCRWDRSGAREHFRIGTSRDYDRDGHLRCVSTFEHGKEVRRSWHRPDGASREGPIEEWHEVGVWTSGDQIFDLGPHRSLLAHAVTADMLDDSIENDWTLVGTLARARRAARDPALLEGCPVAWEVFDGWGNLVPLVGRRGRLSSTLHALRWNPPDASLLAALAEALARGDRAQAALDVIDAALVLDDQPAWRAARLAYQRAAGGVVEVPQSMDARAFALLDEIRASPDDDGVRLVFADHVASAFPEHTALVVAQCARVGDAALREAFLATLPGWLTEHNHQPVRGFLAQLRTLEADAFVDADPELVYRVAPTARALELKHAYYAIARLVTLPHLARYAELSFTEVAFGVRQARELASCKHLDHLEHLGLWSVGVGDQQLQALSAGIAFPRLQSLDIGNDDDSMYYTLDGLRALVDASFAVTLRKLSMANRWLGDDVVAILAKLPALEHLELGGGALTDAGARALLDLPNAWTSLGLGGNELGDDMQRALIARFGDRVRFDR